MVGIEDGIEGDDAGSADVATATSCISSALRCRRRRLSPDAAHTVSCRRCYTRSTAMLAAPFLVFSWYPIQNPSYPSMEWVYMLSDMANNTLLSCSLCTNQPGAERVELCLCVSPGSKMVWEDLCSMSL